MLGLRYHVASLAAVFLALAVGILLGVAISGKISETEDSLQQRKISELEEDLKNARAAGDAAGRRGDAAGQVLEDAYPTLMDDRLAGASVAVLFLGPVDGSIRSEVERTLSDAGAGSPARVISLDMPVDSADLQLTLEGSEDLAEFAGEEGEFGELGRALGREFVAGGDTPLWDVLSSKLVEERSGGFSLEVDAAVVAASWEPPEPGATGADPDQTAATLSFLEGLVGGLDSSGVPVVGVASTGDPASMIELYREGGISSVDDVDSFAGRLALALVLGGGEPGHYGVQETATDGVTPRIEPVTTTVAGG